MSLRSIDRIVAVTPERHGPGLTTRDLVGQEVGAGMDPFLVVSLYDMTGPTFPPHPHAGFSVATYILPESPVGFVNQDTLGHLNRIAPGALHVTVAGSGVLHEEQPETSGAAARGYQIWMDHAHADREIAPFALHLKTADVPVVARDGVVARVVLGESGDTASTLETPTPARLIDLTLAPGARHLQALASDENAFLLVLEGSVLVGAREASADHAAILARDGEAAEIVAGPRGARLTLFAGRPLGGARVHAGPFVASDAAQARRFRDAFQAGRFGRLTPFADQTRDGGALQPREVA